MLSSAELGKLCRLSVALLALAFACAPALAGEESCKPRKSGVLQDLRDLKSNFFGPKDRIPYAALNPFDQGALYIERGEPHRAVELYLYNQDHLKAAEILARIPGYFEKAIDLWIDHRGPIDRLPIGLAKEALERKIITPARYEALKKKFVRALESNPVDYRIPQYFELDMPEKGFTAMRQAVKEPRGKSSAFDFLAYGLRASLPKIEAYYKTTKPGSHLRLEAGETLKELGALIKSDETQLNVDVIYSLDLIRGIEPDFSLYPDASRYIKEVRFLATLEDLQREDLILKRLEELRAEGTEAALEILNGFRPKSTRAKTHVKELRVELLLKLNAKEGSYTKVNGASGPQYLIHEIPEKLFNPSTKKALQDFQNLVDEEVQIIIDPLQDPDHPKVHFDGEKQVTLTVSLSNDWTANPAARTEALHQYVLQKIERGDFKKAAQILTKPETVPMFQLLFEGAEGGSVEFQKKLAQIEADFAGKRFKIEEVKSPAGTKAKSISGNEILNVRTDMYLYLQELGIEFTPSEWDSYLYDFLKQENLTKEDRALIAAALTPVRILPSKGLGKGRNHPDTIALEHPLFPKLLKELNEKGVDVIVDPSLSLQLGVGGYASTGIYIGLHPEAPWSAMLHETQHIEYALAKAEYMKMSPRNINFEKLYAAAILDSPTIKKLSPEAQKQLNEALKFAKRGFPELAANETMAVKAEPHDPERAYDLAWQIHLLRKIPVAQRTFRQELELARAYITLQWRTNPEFRGNVGRGVAVGFGALTGILGAAAIADQIRDQGQEIEFKHSRHNFPNLDPTKIFLIRNGDAAGFYYEIRPGIEVPISPVTDREFTEQDVRDKLEQSYREADKH